MKPSATNPSPAPRQGANRWLVPLLLIGTGAFILLLQLGWIGRGFVLGLLAQWPLLLIAAGVDVLTRGRFRWQVVLVAAVAVVVFGSVPSGPLGAGATTPEVFAYERSSVERLDVELEHGLGSLSVRALPDGSANLIEGTTQAGRGETVERTYRVRGSTATLHLESRRRGSAAGIGGHDRVWDLQLAAGVPLDLDVSTGVGSADLDLRRLRLDELDVDAGVGGVRIVLPDVGGFEVDLAAGVGDVVVVVPTARAVEVEIETGLGRVEVAGTWDRDGDRYLTPGFGNVPNAERGELIVRGGVGAIRIERLDAP